jgi:hypothetical protein
MATETQARATTEQRIDELMALVQEIQASVKDISAKLDSAQATSARGSRQSQRNMEDDDARKVLTDLADLDHNEAAKQLNLSYGQVYSCRLGYTFKHIRQDLQKNKVQSKWLDKDHNDTNGR